jgi:glutaconate CoA-transferase subunit A
MPRELVEAVDHVGDGAEVYFGGFGYNQPFAAAHELIRQGPESLHVVRTSGGIMLDQLIAAGCVREATISHCWNAIGPTPTHAFRRAIEDGIPNDIDVQEFGLGDLMLRLFAGARRLPFVPAGPVAETGQFEHARSDTFTPVTVDDETHHVMQPLNPDVGFIHVPRADERGTAQMRGPHAEIKHGAMACDTLVVQAEEIVDARVIQEQPEQSLLPGFMVDHVVEVPGGAHPSGVLDWYDRDVRYLDHYGEATRTTEGTESFLDTWVYGVADRAEYLDLLAAEGFREVEA